MENIDDAKTSQVGMNLSFCGNASPPSMGPDYDLHQSNLALLKAELKVGFYIIY
jgi:hypothetical protein